jgi:tetratricopeptide (TPR) repeat protein
MKRVLLFCFLVISCLSTVFAQSDELLLAKQYSANGEYQKALEIYQKLYKQDNDAYYTSYVNTLLSLKKFDDAESTAKICDKPGIYLHTAWRH